MYVSRIHKIFVRNRLKLAFINTIEIVLYLYLFLLQTEIACFLVKLAIVIFVFFAAQIDQRELTFAGCGVWDAGSTKRKKKINNSKKDEVKKRKKIAKYIHKYNFKIQVKYKNKESIEYLHITQTNK